MITDSNTPERVGFARPQILIAVGILTLTVTLLAPHVLASRQQADVEATRIIIEQVTQAVVSYAGDHQGRCPTTGASLNTLVRAPGATDSNWNGPYLHIPNQDAWGNSLLYWCPGSFNRDSFDLSSAGPDGIHGNDDDITNWMTP